MGEKTAISWTNHTFSPWWGCHEVSAGCDHCYARQLSERWGHHVWGPRRTTPRRFFGEAHWREPLKWDKAAEAAGERRRVFCASMADVFEFDPTGELDHWRDRLWELIDATPHLDWLLLTKRPEQIRHMLPQVWQTQPCSNIWLGTSVEDQAAADLRIPRLLAVPSVVHWLSCEPLLGPVDLRAWLFDREATIRSAMRGPMVLNREQAESILPRSIDWVVGGGESGPHYRPMDVEWARSLRDQCLVHGVAWFYKQGASRLPGRDVELDGRVWHEFPQPLAVPA